VDLTNYIRKQLESKKILLMTHVIVGYPSLEANWRMLEIMGEAGVDLVELQMPFSEPIADGPTFARANQLALERGIRLEQYFDLLKRSTSSFPFPHLMMGYYNSAFRMGHQTFCERLRTNGAEGFILPDLPFEEYHDLNDYSEKSGQTPILLMTPTNSERRLEEIGRAAKGFVYTVARRGVTGAKTRLDATLVDFITSCRKYTKLPLALGFGLKIGEDVRALQGQAEVAIVGSALLERWEEQGEEGYTELVRELSQSRF
jgi:tryptophan synthase alpha chain